MKRKIYKLLSNAKQGLFALALTVFSGTAYSQATYTFNYTGSVQTINLLAGTYSIQCWGANGGDGGSNTANAGSGGKGGYSGGTFTTSTNTALYIYAGGKGQSNGTSATALVNAPGGWNGGGGGFIGSASTNFKGGGGGGTDVRTTQNTTYSNRIIVAGGGGGAGGALATSTGFLGLGGSGGGISGQDGVLAGSQNTHNGKGGTQSAGGAGGVYGTAVGVAGSFGIGGDGGSGSSNTFPAGGGGGGWYGGGGGAIQGGGGAGGSGYIGGLASGVTYSVGQGGFAANPDVAGNGMVLITELCSITLTATGSNSLNPSICSGQSLTLTTNGISNYAWSTGNTTSPTIAVSPTVTTVYTLSATSPSNCTASRSMTVIVNATGPVLTSTTVPSTGSVCLGQTVSLTAGGAVSYTLAGGPGNLTNGQTFTPTATSNYTITGQNGCGTASVVTTISVSALPVTAVASSTLICSATPATLTAGGATNYTWTTQTSTSTNSSYIVNPAANTTYSLYGVTGPCAGSTIITVNTKANPTISITPSGTAICLGSSVSLVASGTSTSYAWSTGQSGISISAAPQTLTLITVTGTNTNNCTSSVGQLIYVNPNPTVSASASNPVVCVNGPSTLMASGADTYTWSTGPAGTSVVVNPTAGSTYTVTGSYTTGCSSATVVSVSVLTPTISVTANTAVCSGSHVVIGAMGADTYTWANNNATGPNISVGPAATTIYTVTGSVSDAGTGVTCDATNTLQVTVNNNPTISATSNRTNNAICIGESAVLTADGAGANGTYTWTGGSGAHAASGITVTPIANQIYVVAGTDDNGCRNQTTIQIAVFTCVGIPAYTSNPVMLSVYPNPSTGEFNISSDQAISLQVSNELGQVIKIITLSNKEKEVKINNLSAGVYFITGHNTNGSVKQKLIITK